MPLLMASPKPRIILGTMTFGPDKDTGARITSLEDYNKALDYFQAQGFNEIDTARLYIGGKQEAWTAQAHWKERGLKLATKCYPTKPGQHSAVKVRETLELSLRELNTDCVDIFYLHAPDRSVPFEETLKVCNDMHKEGKFVELGLSNYTAFEVAEIVIMCKERGWVRPTVYQGMLNAIARSIESEVVTACHRYGMSIVTYNPLGGGILSGKIKSAEVPTEGRFSDADSVMGTRYRKRYFKDATFDALRVIEPVAQKHNLTLPEIGLRWVRHHSALQIDDGKDGIIIGVSSFAQLESNLKDLEKGPLPDEVVKALDDAWMVAKPTTADYWHLDLKYTYNTQKALFPPTVVA